MTDADRELMKRYIYQVTRRLPGDQRKETAMELEELITDMAGQKGMEETLKELGDPAAFAGKYRDEPRFLIGPDYYEDYIWLLKIVLAAVAVSVVVSGIAQGLIENGGTRMIFDIILNGVIGGISAVGAVTILFLALEKWHIHVDFQKESAGNTKEKAAPARWVPDLLPPVPDSKAVIKRSDYAVNLVIEALLAGLLIFAPWLFGAYIFEDGAFVRTIPIFNLERWNVILPLLLISLAAGFLDDVVRLIRGCYCRMVLTVCLISGVVQAVLAWLLFQRLPFFNPDFMREIRAEFGWEGSKGALLSLYGTGWLETILLLVIWVCVLLEIGVTAYKTVKYGKEL